MHAKQDRLLPARPRLKGAKDEGSTFARCSQSDPTDRWAQPQAAPDKTTMQVMVAHEGAETMQRAARLFRSLTARLGPEFDFQVHWWNYKRLTQDTAIEWVTQAAMEARMVVCSMNAGGGMPRSCEDWIESWRLRKIGEDSALVALLGTDKAWAAKSASLEVYLRQVADAANMDFFVKRFSVGIEQATPPCRQRRSANSPSSNDPGDRSASLSGRSLAKVSEPHSLSVL